MAFEGFPAETFGFYEQLEADNSKGFWDAHHADYLRYVREPFLALLAELEAGFGSATVFRPYRDVRFSADKTPYKVYQGAFAERLAGTGFYVQVSADGLTASGGFHSHGADQVERYRTAAAREDSGQKLAAVVTDLRSAGLVVDGDQLKTRPRGVAADHPRLELLRYRSLTATRNWPAGPLLHDRQALSLVSDIWQRLIPLCDWLCEHVGAAQLTKPARR